MLKQPPVDLGWTKKTFADPGEVQVSFPSATAMPSRSKAAAPVTASPILAPPPTLPAPLITGGISHFEKITGRFNNLLPFVWLERLRMLGRAIARVHVSGGYGTGWLINGGLLMTNNHVIPSASAAAGARAEFGYEEDLSGVVRMGRFFAVDEFIATDADLDYTIVSLRGSPMSDFGSIDLSAAKDPLLTDVASAFPIVVQHPEGGPKMWSGFENTLEYVERPKVWYSSDTNPGSSGSVVLGQDLRPIALHHAGGMYLLGGQQKYVNEGILLSAILAHLRTTHPALIENLPSGMERFGAAIRKFISTPVGSAGVDISIQAERFREATSNGDTGKAIELVSTQLYAQLERDPEFMAALDQIQAEASPEIAPLLVAVAGVVSGAAIAHWGHRTSRESIARGVSPSDPTEITLDFGLLAGGKFHIELPHVSGPGEVYSECLRRLGFTGVPPCYHVHGCDPAKWPDFIRRIRETKVSQEVFPVAVAIYFAGVAAGAAAYQRGK